MLSKKLELVVDKYSKYNYNDQVEYAKRHLISNNVINYVIYLHSVSNDYNIQYVIHGLSENHWNNRKYLQELLHHSDNLNDPLKSQISELCDILLDDDYILENCTNKYFKALYINKLLISLVGKWRNNQSDNSTYKEVNELNNITRDKNMNYNQNSSYSSMYGGLHCTMYSDDSENIKWTNKLLEYLVGIYKEMIKMKKYEQINNMMKETTLLIKEEKIITKKPRKKLIPKALRMKLWKETFGDTLNGKCCCCERELQIDNFEAGHIIAEKNGGLTVIENLSVCCKPCNTSMGVQNLEEFKKSLQYNVTDSNTNTNKTKMEKDQF